MRPLLIACFLAAHPALAAGPGEPQGGDAAALARHLVETTGVRAGLCVRVGCGDGRLAAALADAGDFIVHGLATDAKAVAGARERLRSRGLYGRATAERLPLHPLPYPENLVNLLVADDLPGALEAGLSLREVLRVLVPGGAAVLGSPATGQDAAPAEKRLRAALAEAGVADARVFRRGGVWAHVRKPRPREMDDWTHHDRGPEGTGVSLDALAGPARRLKWTAAPTMYLSHFSRPEVWVSAGGRVFYVYDERHPRLAGPSRFALVARDAFNGKLLWRRAVPVPGKRSPYQPVVNPAATVATPHRLYVPLGKGGTLQALRADTGELVKDYGVRPGMVRLHRGALIVTAEGVRVLDPDTGQLRWKSPLRYCHRIVAAEGRVFAWGQRRDPKTRQEVGGIACFDLAAGRELWWRVVPERLLCFAAGRVIAATRIGLNRQATRRIVALEGETGRVAWTQEHSASGKHEVFCVGTRLWYLQDEMVWSGIDLATGKPDGRLDSYTPGAITHHFTRCTGQDATCRYLITGNTMDFLEVATGQHLRSTAARASCTWGLRFANGMAYTFPVDCGCFKSLRGVLGLAPAEPETTPAPPAAPRLVRGPAYGQAPPDARPVDPAREWPCYRHDAARSGRVAAEVADDLSPLWQADVGPEPTAPTVAGGRVFVASGGDCRLTALDAATGDVRWRFTPGGPIDSPPTLHQGLCLFGCRDGWVYCLRADDGRLLWRFRAAPMERRIIALGRLESPVPAWGSVIVVGDTVYCSAGRSSELDGGVWVHALDPLTGRLKWEQNIPRAELVGGRKLERRVLSEQGALGGLLVSDGQHVYMRGWRFAPADGTRKFYYNWRGVLQGGGKGGLLDATMKQPWRRRTTGQMLVFDDRTTCGFLALAKDGWRLAYFTTPGKGEYHVFAQNFDPAGKPDEDRPGWALKACPVAVEAMLLAGRKLFLGGAPDEPEPTGGRLWALALDDGRKLRELKLDAPPVFDGLAAADGRLYVSGRNGRLLCLGHR